MADNEQYLLNEQVSFVQHFLPGLEAGEYQLQVEQHVLQSDGKTPVSGQKAYSNTYTFAVTGDRFKFTNPASILASVFPADNGSGEYTNVLPHVVFSKETFPWTRYPTLKVPYTPPQPGSDVDSDVPTWLWVMLLDEDDVANFPSLNLAPLTCTIGDLYPEAVKVPKRTIPPPDYSYFSDATDLSGLEPGQNTDDAIQAIDIPLDLFWQIGPTVADLSELAHGRVVSLINQPNDASTVLGEPTGSFSIVFGNRLPNNQKKAFAFLVSLEKLENFLPQTGGLPPNNNYSGSAKLRLAVLKSWTFFSTGQSATFVHQLESLNGCTPGGPPASNTNIRLDYKGSNLVVQGALNMGYVPLNETMRTGENNVSWYRGPLVPYSITSSNIKLPVTSPDEATIFDPTTGMLDVSYAAAWTIGRLVALQDASFSTALYKWKKGLTLQIVTNIENELIAEEFGPALLGKQLQGVDGRKSVNAGTLFKQTVLALKHES